MCVCVCVCVWVGGWVCVCVWRNPNSRVPDQNGISHAYYIVVIYHSDQQPSICAERVPEAGPPRWPSGMMLTSRTGNLDSIPGPVISVTEKLVLYLLPSQTSSFRGSLLGLVGPVSAYYDGQIISDLICRLCLRVVARKIVRADPFLRFSWHVAGTLRKREPESKQINKQINKSADK